MPRYIDADEFEKRIKSYDTDDCVDKAMYNFAHNIMMFTSTADVLERKVGNKKKRTMIPNKCPHCGAPVNIARAICEYCGTTFEQEPFISKSVNTEQNEKKIFVTYREMSGFSTDVKPTDELMQNNSLFLELDTNTLYYYADGEWVPVGQSPSGGGDDGGGLRKKGGKKKMRLIDADGFKKVLKLFSHDKIVKISAVETAIDATPTVNVPDIKVGKWKHDDESPSYYCSVCGRRAYGLFSEIYTGQYRYCPNCGAEMKGDKE